MDNRTPQAFRSAPLKKTTFKTEQERADAFAAAIIFTPEAGAPGAPGSGSPGPPGTPGSTVSSQVKTISIPEGAESVDTGVSLSGKSVLLQAEDADIYIKSVSGTTVYLSGPAPSGYSVVISWYDIS